MKALLKFKLILLLLSGISFSVSSFAVDEPEFVDDSYYEGIEPAYDGEVAAWKVDDCQDADEIAIYILETTNENDSSFHSAAKTSNSNSGIQIRNDSVVYKSENCYDGREFTFDLTSVDMDYKAFCWAVRREEGNNNWDFVSSSSRKCITSDKVPDPPPPAPSGFEMSLEPRTTYNEPGMLLDFEFLKEETVTAYVSKNEGGAEEFTYKVVDKNSSCGTPNKQKGFTYGNGNSGTIVDIDEKVDHKLDDYTDDVLDKDGVDSVPRQRKLCYAGRIKADGSTKASAWSTVGELEIKVAKRFVPDCIYLNSRSGDMANLNTRNNSIVEKGSFSDAIDYDSLFANKGGALESEYIANNFPSFTICEGSSCSPQYMTYQDQWQDRIFVDAWCRNKLPTKMTMNIGLRSSLPACSDSPTTLCLEAYTIEDDNSDNAAWNTFGMKRAPNGWGWSRTRMRHLTDGGYHKTMSDLNGSFIHVATFAVRNPTPDEELVNTDMLGVLFQAAYRGDSNSDYDELKLDGDEVVSHTLGESGMNFIVGTEMKAEEGDLTCEVIFDGQSEMQNVAAGVYYAAAKDVTFQLQLLPRLGDDGNRISLPPNMTIPIEKLSTITTPDKVFAGSLTGVIETLTASTATTVSATYAHEACAGGQCECEVKVYPKAVAANTINITPAGNCELYAKMKAHYYHDGIKAEVLDKAEIENELPMQSFEDTSLGKFEVGGDVPVRGLFNLAQYDLHSRVPDGLKNRIVFGNGGAVEFPSPIQRKYDELIIMGRLVVGTKKGSADSGDAVALSEPMVYASVNPISFEVSGIFNTIDPSSGEAAINKYLKDNSDEDLNIVFEAILKKRRVVGSSTTQPNVPSVNNSWRPDQQYYKYDAFDANTFLTEFMKNENISSEGSVNNRFVLRPGVDYIVPFMESSCTNMLPFSLPTYDFIAKDREIENLSDEEKLILSRSMDLKNKTICRFSRPFSYKEVLNGTANLNILALTPHNPIEKYPSNLQRASKMPKPCDRDKAVGAEVSCWSLPENYMPKALTSPNNQPYDTHSQCHTRTCRKVEAAYTYQCNCGSNGCSTCTATEPITVCSDKYKAGCMIKETNASDECGDNTAFRFSGYTSQMAASLGCVAKYDRILEESGNLVVGTENGLANDTLATGIDLSGVSVTATLEGQGIIPYGVGIADLAQGGEKGGKGSRAAVAPNLPQVSLGGAKPDLYSLYSAVGLNTTNADIMRRRRALQRALTDVAPNLPYVSGGPIAQLWNQLNGQPHLSPSNGQISAAGGGLLNRFNYWYSVLNPTTNPIGKNQYGYACVPCRFAINGNTLEDTTTLLPMDQDNALSPRQPIYKFTRQTEPESCTELTTFTVRYFGSNECQPGDSAPEDYTENFCASKGFPSDGCSAAGIKDSYTRPDSGYFGGAKSQEKGNSNYAGQFTVRLCSNSKFGSKNVSVSWSPIVIDIAGQGIYISRTSAEAVYFDITGDGAKEWIDWPLNTEGAAILVRPDKDGKVNSIHQLFGDSKADNGFEALKEYDSNGDGYISPADKNFRKLRLWFDYNRNGEVDGENELATLHEKGVHKIHLKYYKRLGVSGPEGRQLASTYYNMGNGKFQNIIDAYFGVHGK